MHDLHPEKYISERLDKCCGDTLDLEPLLPGHLQSR
jgi:hypothetical protein